jgi:hypothetical protein
LRKRSDWSSRYTIPESKRFAIALMLALPFFVFAYLHMSRCIRSKLCFVIHVEDQISSQIIVCSQAGLHLSLSFLPHPIVGWKYPIQTDVPTMVG